MKITKITIPSPVKISDPSGLSESEKQIINNGGCLYPKNKIDIFDRSANPAIKQGVIAPPLTPKTSITETGTVLTESEKRMLNGGGCLYPNPKSLNFAVELPRLADKKIAKVDTVKFEQKAPNSGSNNLNVRMPGDIAPVSGRSLTLSPPAVNPNPAGKPGAVVRSASFLAGEAVGLGKSLVSGIADVGKFLYDVESAVIARGHDLIFEGTPNGSFTQVYQPTSSLGTASSEGKGGEAALKIITEAPDRISDASVRTGILVEQGKYYEAGKAFGSGPLAETTAALGTVQLATSTPVAAGSFRLATSGEAASIVTVAPESEAVIAATPKPVTPSVSSIPTTILRPGPFAEIISQARSAAGGIAGDCETATAVIRSVIKEAGRGNWDWHDQLGRPGFHEFAQLADGRILDATAGQYLANGSVTAQEVANVPGLGAAIESGVFTTELHNALRALVTR
ncbi:MAG TPA: hypothetical protein VH815_04845 [Acidobacteriota bacterium]